ncbi:tRNA dihydrouridine(20/20a) synthase DusA [Frateuria aurantia]
MSLTDPPSIADTPHSATIYGRKLAVAPMLDWTDRHCRYFHRLLSPHALLYTEMVTSAALVRGRQLRLLEHDPAEAPVALQLGGSDPAELAEAARLGAGAGYHEINLNVGCPSDRVQSGEFGACLMRTPDRVADCVKAMQDAVATPVTVKCRIGVDDQDPEIALQVFTEAVQATGIRKLIVHARKAWLQGLSPKENRDIPPLDYPRVFRLKQDFPDLEIILNGGLTTVDASVAALEHVDGVMLGRAAYHDPYILAQLEHALYGTALPSREQILQRMLGYCETTINAGTSLKHVTRHVLGLYQGQAGARRFRRVLSEGAHREGARPELMLTAMPSASPAAESQA